MLRADLGFSVEPAVPAICIALMALALSALTVWTYLGVPRAGWRRVLTVLVLRLLALSAALLLLLRPSIATTRLEGIEPSKLFVLFDQSESMSISDADGQPTRWQVLNQLWQSHEVQRRLQELKDVQKVEIVKYLAAEELRPDDPAAGPTGKRTDIGNWLHQLFARHAHEKRPQGILLFSDGGDNGTRYSAQEKAGAWKGIAPIHAFGVGDPGNQKFKKHLTLARIDVKPKPIAVKAEMEISAGLIATGYDGGTIDVAVWIEEVNEKKPQLVGEIKEFEIKPRKEQKEISLRVAGKAPDRAGEHKLTMKAMPKDKSEKPVEISTYVQVIKPRIHVLWVDSARVYEPRFAIDALLSEERFKVEFVIPPTSGKADPFAIYKLDKEQYDVIVIGDLSAQRFCQARPEVLDRIKKMVANKTGLLMLGGVETFANGGWDKQQAIMDLLPVKFDGPPAFSEREVKIKPTPGAPSFLQLHANRAESDKIWGEWLGDLDGMAALGSVAKGSSVLLGVDGQKDRPVLVATQSGLGGRVAVFASDATARCWYDTAESVQAHHAFWKQLIGWLAQQEQTGNEIWIKLDKRRLSTDPNDALGFTFGLRGKNGEVVAAKFDAEILGPKDATYPVRFQREGQHERGNFQGPKESGEYKLVITAKDVKASGMARFVVADDHIEMQRPAADHGALAKIAEASDGRFYLANEANLLRLLDELQSQASRDARQKVTHWPDWQRLPPSDHLRDQIAGLWSSFGFLGFFLFVLCIGCEWTLRRLWGLV